MKLIILTLFISIVKAGIYYLNPTFTIIHEKLLEKEFFTSECYQKLVKVTNISCESCLNIYSDLVHNHINYKKEIFKEYNQNENKYTCFYIKNISNVNISTNFLHKIATKSKKYLIYLDNTKFHLSDKNQKENVELIIYSKNNSTISLINVKNIKAYNVSLHCYGASIHISSNFIHDMLENENVALNLYQCYLFGRVKEQTECIAQRYLVKMIQNWNPNKIDIIETCEKYSFNLIMNINCDCEIIEINPLNRVLKYKTEEFSENYRYFYQTKSYSNIQDFKQDKCMNHFQSFGCQTCIKIQQNPNNTILITYKRLKVTLNDKNIVYDCFSLKSFNNQDFNSSFIQRLFDIKIINLAVHIGNGNFIMDDYHRHFYIHFYNHSKLTFNVLDIEYSKNSKIIAECNGGTIGIDGKINTERFKLNISKCHLCDDFDNVCYHYQNENKCNCNPINRRYILNKDEEEMMDNFISRRRRIKTSTLTTTTINVETNLTTLETNNRVKPINSLIWTSLAILLVIIALVVPFFACFVRKKFKEIDDEDDDDDDSSNNTNPHYTGQVKSASLSIAADSDLSSES